MHGKGKKFVPVLIPKDAIKAMDLLLKFRQSYGIKERNKFLFASKGSYNHCSGWTAIKSVTNMVPVAINATLNRHRVSTIYASLDMKAEHRQIYFHHLSHSDNTARDNYRCPPGIQETLVMGRILQNIDDGNYFLCKMLLNSFVFVIQNDPCFLHPFVCY